MNPKVFISHASADQRVAEAICNAMENRGFGCWIASRDAGPGDWQEAIVRAIRSASAMILVFTENANNSSEIKKELVLASRSNVVIIPVRVENVAPNDALSFQFATSQWVNLFEDWEREIDRLGRWIERIRATAKLPASDTRPDAAIAWPPGRSIGQQSGKPSLLTSPLSGSSAHHIIATLLVTVGLASLVTGVSVAVEDQLETLRITNALERLRGKPQTDIFSLSLQPVPGGAVELVLAAILVAAAGFGIIAGRKWARNFGCAICVAGLLTSGYVGYVSLTTANFGPASIRARILTPFDDSDGIFLYGGFLSFIFMILFAAGAVLLALRQKSWRNGGMDIAPAQMPLASIRAFQIAAIVFFALTLAAMHAYQIHYAISRPFWMATFAVLEIGLLAYCWRRFRQES